MEGERLESKFNSVHISIKLPAKVNEMLTVSARDSKRKKREEALIRLMDHLTRYTSISRVSVADQHEK